MYDIVKIVVFTPTLIKIQKGKFNWFSVLRPYWMDSALRHCPGLTGSQHKRSKAVHEIVLQEI